MQILHTERLEREVVEQMEFNLLFGWFVGLTNDHRVWDHFAFRRNRKRLVDEGMACKCFERVKLIADRQEPLPEEHVSAGRTLIGAWATQKSVLPKNEHNSPGNGPGLSRGGEKRCNDTQTSRTDRDARLYRKSHNE